MKKVLLVVTMAMIAFTAIQADDRCDAMFTFGMPRDWWVFNQFYEAPCSFPFALNPCAVCCRPPEWQKQAVPCAFETACPSVGMPCHGFTYGANPYPIFKAW